MKTNKDTQGNHQDNYKSCVDLLSYNKVLDRGFVLIKDNKNKTIKRAKQIINKTNARIQFFDGVVDAVLNKNNND